MTCIDISKTAIERIKQESVRRKVNIISICADLENYKIKDYYDIVISSGFFHLLSKKKAFELVQMCKEHTNKNGLNIHEVLLEDDPSKEYNLEGGYYAKEDLFNTYSGWTILSYEEYEEYDDEEEYNNRISLIVVKK